ncbi:FUSC family protein [Pseudomonas sp. LS1212]|uniref:FUSC family protein n=1 Tax=Pseudomonas sp. LS1212 TaxID=2972478 RepID=UPI00215CD8DE|nr:FUSC family protein [Pseudomonas sp. LS1212]UVJ46081.1 FUSC family protein [Pseudomonas sp. LS1212]
MQPFIILFRTALVPDLQVLRFALRTIVAALLTLYLAFIFDLDQPKWALMTVVIVSVPMAGMTLQRSFGQVIGTVVGAVVAVVITALFAQAPLPFLLTLSLWLALCTAGGTLLRYTDSQASVLSGFTAVIVAMLAVPEQDNTLTLAITRVTETLLAVACVALVSLLTARPEAVASGYFAKIDSLIKLIALHAAAVVRGDEDEAQFQQRQLQLLSESNALEGLRRHLYFDAPRLREANDLVQLFGNQLVLMGSRLMIMHRQRRLIAERWQGALPLSIARLREDELQVLDELSRSGRSITPGQRRQLQSLSRRFEAAAEFAQQIEEQLPSALRSLAWALRSEQAGLLRQLDDMLELDDAIQEGRQASCAYAKGRSSSLFLDYPLAAMNGVRAFVALMLGGAIWIQTGWDGARAGMVLVAVLCSLMASFPRPLAACQNYARGFLLALVVSALYQFMLIPSVGDFEMLALLLLPLLYLVAVALVSPMTAGIGMGLGLSTLLMFGPQNVGAWQNTAIQWFEFAGAYIGAVSLSLLVFAVVFPFNAVLRMQRLYERARDDVRALIGAPPSDQAQYDFESRMSDRLNTMQGLLPAAPDRLSRARFDSALSALSLGVALSRLKGLMVNNPLLPAALGQRLELALEQIASVLGSRSPVDPRELLADLQQIADELQTLHEEHVGEHRGSLWKLFALRVSLIIAAALLERDQEWLGVQAVEAAHAGVSPNAH